MYINDNEQHYESSGLWATCILNPGKEQKSTRN